MREIAIPLGKQVPAASSLSCRARTTTFAEPATGSASMRKFGEYVFLEDSRYARQAKSWMRLASRRVGAPGCRLASPLSRRGHNDERKGWLYSAASSGARFS